MPIPEGINDGPDASANAHEHLPNYRLRPKSVNNEIVDVVVMQCHHLAHRPIASHVHDQFI